MKIVHVLFTLNYGGIETMLVNIVNEQVKYADVSIVLINDMYDDSLVQMIDSNVKFVKINRPKGSKNPYYVFRLNYEIFKLNPDVIHSHTSSIIDYILLPYMKKIMVNTIHTSLTEWHCKYIAKYRKIYAISESVYNDIRNYNKQLNVELITNGIRVDSFTQRNDVNSSHYKIVQLGRLFHDVKGQDLLIEAVKILRRKGFDDFSVDFIGEGTSEEYLKQMVHEYNLGDYVNFLGAKEPAYIYSHLCDYSLFVQPSRIEGFGLTIAEAFAAKVPVLVSKLEGPMEVIGDGKYGGFFEYENPQDLAEKIMKMRECVSENTINEAFERVNELYSINRTASEYLESYKTIVK